MTYHRAAGLVASMAATLLWAATTGAQTTSGTGEISLDSLLNTRISTASKYLQTSAEAAASVTILSADEIRQMGYTNLQQILESVPGMYVSNDRSYPYLGTRGFGRPSDYNNRILVLVDGHSLNEQVFGSAPVGTDLPINLDAVERLEVVRGPGSALYGTNAMFAVINIVTKSGPQLSGAIVSAGLGSGLQRQVGATIGHAISTRTSFMISALGTQSEGQSQTYSEYISSDNVTGAVRHLDWENGGSVLGTLISGNVTTRVGYRRRSKGVPTGAYGVLFGDARALTVDESMWTDVSLKSDIGRNYHVSARVYADRSVYRGVFPFFVETDYSDRSNSSVAGAEGMLVWDVASRNRLTIGSEVRRMFVTEYFARDDAGEVSGTNAPYTVVSLLAQNELELTTRLKLVGGVRFDQMVGRWQTLAPRFALIGTPDAATTVKLLYGEAFRAPSVAEADVTTPYYTENHALRPERIATYELAVERRLSTGVLIGASAYHYSIRNLIEPVDVEETGEDDTYARIQFENLTSVAGKGLELSVNMQPVGSPVALRGWYTLQNTRDDSSGLRLTNSPTHTANISAVLRHDSGIHTALTVRRESGRRMLSDESTPSFTRSDVNVSYAPSGRMHMSWLNGFDISLRASNLLNARYAVPGGLEHLQQSIQQDGRMLSLRVRREF